MKILSIETSCDETSAAVIAATENGPVILSNVVSSQIDLHTQTGGVVPEVASRAHMEAILPVITEALLKSAVTSQLSKDSANCTFRTTDYQRAIRLLSDITHIAVTAGPGLIGSLLVGYNAAKTLAYAKNLPIVPINHIEGHIYSALANLSIKDKFPCLALTVSGGHTSLILVKNYGDYQLLGETLDDAVGEAYDKVAKLLGLGYPGGPIISKLADNFRVSGNTDPAEIKFPRPIVNDGTFNFSFSGLKTAVLVWVKKYLADNKIASADKIDLAIKEKVAFAFEEAVADVLCAKAERAIKKYKSSSVLFVGGVSANSYLRRRLKSVADSAGHKTVFACPEMGLCGDNAAMIGLAAYFHIKNGVVAQWQDTSIDANLELKSNNL